MVPETLALFDGLDNVFLIKHDLKRILERTIQLLTIADGKLLLDVVTVQVILLKAV